MFEALLDQAVDVSDKRRAVYADSAYRFLALHPKAWPSHLPNKY